MRIVQYTLRNNPSGLKHLGLKFGQDILNIQNIKPNLPNSLLELLNLHSSTLQELEKIRAEDFKEKIPIEQVNLLAPLQGPDKLLCVGMNYKDHCEEQNAPIPKEPIFFSKFASNLIGPFDNIPYPSVTEQLDYEVELAFIIGKKGKDISLGDAMDHVFGYTVAHDVSARDWQFNKNGGQWLLGKAMDGFCPIGPEIVTKSEIPDPNQLAIKCRVNGATKQSSNTNQMVHKIGPIVSFVSKCLTLLPGDIIITGTPPGVGVFQKPQFFLKRGDIVECEIENIGIIRNKIE